ncbi:hypothetical protein HG530_009352 [Fusarium avenaceum]|nr:hypothetical protein HG530_009352 [Fusarium avenaceum]
MLFSGEETSGELNFWGVFSKSANVPSVSSSLHRTPPFFFTILIGVKLMLFLEAPITLRRRGDPLMGLTGAACSHRHRAIRLDNLPSSGEAGLEETVNHLLGVSDSFFLVHGEGVGKKHSDSALERLESLHVVDALLTLSSRVFIGCSKSLNTLSGEGIPLIALFSEFSKEHALGVLLLGLELVDQSHLLVDLNQEVLDVAVDVKDVARHLGLDVLCPVGVSKGVLISAEGELEQSGKLAVSVRNVLFLATVAESVNAASKSEKGFVDVGTLGKALTTVLGDRRSLGSSKIDDTEGSHGVRFACTSRSVLLGNVDLKNGVRSRRGGVGLGSIYCTVFVSSDNQIHDFLDILGMVTRQSGDANSLVAVLSEHQATLTTAARKQQVANGFVVNLKIAQTQLSDLVLAALINLLKQFLHGHENDTRMLGGTGNGVCLSAASGAVGENRRIVAIEHAVEERSGGAFVDFGLCCVIVKDPIKSKDLVLDLFRCGYDRTAEFLYGVVLGRIKDSV